MKIDVCFSPALYPYYKEDGETIVVVVDIFRATTSMCMALNNGAASIIPVATVEEAKAYKDKGYLVGGERNVVKFEFGDFGNTPSEYTREKVEGKDVVISTTNGTHAIDMAEDCSCLIIGSFSNISAVADFCISQQKNVLVLCAGWKDKFNLEDTLFGGALTEILVQKGGYNAHFDAAGVALSMWKDAKSDIMKYIANGEHMKRLEAHNLIDVADFCVTSDTVKVLPVYDKKTKKITVL
ncbi:2-phosphosulfolactate phosphatase [Dysgonomonas macrotermitis]|uniref:Probable 2-phosphosulfolactate phosphatase n=1 Tax=Dysgonomonas macrotermitis TaxID=1346286 RepID=A0A1M5DS43_9BACT|nr:2-phosphosulfolactate phosphatase [Dysgonomonas macrotermitis]SHF69671.1 2-phosphosulfolactate phosphatase [Dysgonomonas macrotermitis]